MDIRKLKCEIGVTSFILAATIYLQYVAYTTKVRTNVQGMQSMDFPKIILYLLIILCLFILITGIRKLVKFRRLEKAQNQGQETVDKPPMIHKKIILSTGLIIAYAIAWNIIGFILSSIAFFYVESRVLDNEKPWWQVLLLSLGYTAIVYVVFGLAFRVSFPEPIFELMGW